MARPQENAHSGKVAQAVASTAGASVKTNRLFLCEELVQLKEQRSRWQHCASCSTVQG